MEKVITKCAKFSSDENALIDAHCKERNITVSELIRNSVMREILADDAFKDQDPLMDYLHETHPNIIRDDTQKRLMRVHIATPLLLLELMKLITDNEGASTKIYNEAMLEATEYLEEWGYYIERDSDDGEAN